MDPPLPPHSRVPVTPTVNLCFTYEISAEALAELISIYHIALSPFLSLPPVEDMAYNAEPRNCWTEFVDEFRGVQSDRQPLKYN